MTSQDAHAFRQSVEARLAALSTRGTMDVNRLRRHFVFQRILVRLAPEGVWLLKGGFAVEVRLMAGARSTLDLDLVLMDATSQQGTQERLLEALERDAGDHLKFRLSLPKPITVDEAGNSGWRFTVESRMAGREFASVRIDVASRPDEIGDAVAPLRVEPLVLPGELSSVDMPAVDIAQHAAEKLHAMARDYAGGRPSSRVKDLVDIALFSEAGLLPDPRVTERLIAVYLARDESPPPAALPALPANWAPTYDDMAAELGLSTSFGEALSLAGSLFAADDQLD